MDRTISQMVTPSGFGMPLPSNVVNSGMLDRLSNGADFMDATFSLGKVAGAGASFARGDILGGLQKSFAASVGILSDFDTGLVKDMGAGIKGMLMGDGKLTDVINPLKADLGNKLEIAMTPEMPAPSSIPSPPAPGASSMRPS